tara:strand:- start:33021 stop:34034 length:1014 start_codon:yes stop_codon:yes gene_type:complete
MSNSKFADFRLPHYEVTKEGIATFAAKYNLPIVNVTTIRHKGDVIFILIQFEKNKSEEDVYNFIMYSKLWSEGTYHLSENYGWDFADVAQFRKFMAYLKKSPSDKNQEVRFCSHILDDGCCKHAVHCGYVHCMFMRTLKGTSCLVPTPNALEKAKVGRGGKATSRFVLSDDAVKVLHNYYAQCNTEKTSHPKTSAVPRTVKVKEAPQFEEHVLAEEEHVLAEEEHVLAEESSTLKKSWADEMEEAETTDSDDSDAKKVKLPEEKVELAEEKIELPKTCVWAKKPVEDALQARVVALEKQVNELEKQLVDMKHSIDVVTKNAIAEVLRGLATSFTPKE